MSKSFLKELQFLAYDKSLGSDPQAMREAWSKLMKAHGIPIPEWECMTQIDRDESIYLALKASGADSFMRKNIYPLLDRRIWIPHAPLELEKLGEKITVTENKNNRSPEVLMQIQPGTPEARPEARIERVGLSISDGEILTPLPLENAPEVTHKAVGEAVASIANVTASSVVDDVAVLTVVNAEKSSQTLHLKDSAIPKTTPQRAAEIAVDTTARNQEMLLLAKRGSKDAALEEVKPISTSSTGHSGSTQEVESGSASSTTSLPSQLSPVVGSALSAPVSVIAPAFDGKVSSIERRDRKYSSVDSKTECEFILSRGEVIGAVTIGPVVIDGKELSPVGYRVLFDEKSKSFSIIESRGESMRLFECPRAKKFLDATLSVQLRDEYGHCNHVGLGHLRGAELLFKIEELDKQFIQFSCFLDKNAAYFKYLESKSEVRPQGLTQDVIEDSKSEPANIKAPQPAAPFVKVKDASPQEVLTRESSYRGIRTQHPHQPQMRGKTPAYQASYVAPVASLLQHVARPKAQPIKNEYKAEANWDSDEELTDEDLARLRGELPMEPAYPRQR